MKYLIFSLFFFLLFACNRKISSESSSGLFPIKEFGKWGYIDSKGKTVVKCQFDGASPFSEGLAAIRIDSAFGFIDTMGNVVIKPRFYETSEFSDSLCKVVIKKNGLFKIAFIRPNGNTAFTTNYDNVASFSYGRAAVEINNEVCFIDKKGKVVINTHFPYGGNALFHEGLAMVWGGTSKWVDQPDGSRIMQGDTTKYIDTSGKEVIILEGMGYDDFAEGVALARIKDRPCYLDRKGKPRIIPEREDLTYFSFSDGMAQAVIAGVDHRAGFIDTTGKVVIPIKYAQIRDFKEGLAAYQDKGIWGFINKKGVVSISPQFEQVEYGGFKNGLCKVMRAHQWGYINHTGKFVWKEQIGIEYGKLDLVKWKLDTLNIAKPLYTEKLAGNDNFPRKRHFPLYHQLALNVDTTDMTVFADRYFAYKLYLINASKDTSKIPAQDGRIKIIQQAINKNGVWQDIENFVNSFCGNSYHVLLLAPDEFQIFASPIYKGTYKTKLRYRLKTGGKEIYSNVFTGTINPEQFLQTRDKPKSEISLWVN
ncbi:WG repeat-containing protein [Hymenobacter monticola]|uniref:WG repeat-containing protein n=1 Tax=Hymenobacter monticola TaxID=1705399 RepID=A0ABY4B1E7_9BACT|nr:WG repeat-containing protein [Hymenobacter monticola]UOE32177.1 WG repeat-containing protein [Hymenobacter monticola]